MARALNLLSKRRTRGTKHEAEHCLISEHSLQHFDVAQPRHLQFCEHVTPEQVCGWVVRIPLENLPQRRIDRVI